MSSTEQTRRQECHQAVFSRVYDLQGAMQRGEDIVGRTISDFTCLNGRQVTAGIIHDCGGCHKTDCLWNYAVKCRHCGYDNNLAKYTPSPSTVCTCTRFRAQ